MDDTECNKEQSSQTQSGSVTLQQKSNTGTHNEVIDADNPQTPEEVLSSLS